MKAAVVGLGVIGKVHVKVLKKLGVDVVAACDISESKLGQFPEIKGYTDYSVMLEEVKPDVVHICTPHCLHAQMIIAALDKNINVLCEKPMCISRDEIDAVLAAEARSSAKLGVCHQNRYNRENIFVKEYLKDKKILGGYGNVVWRRRADYYNKAEWRGTKDGEGGGVLINQALHTLDLLQWFLGMPEFVTADCKNLTLKGVIEVEDTASLICSGGAEFAFFATNGGASYFPVSISVKTEEEIIQVIPDKVITGDRLIDFKNGGEFFGKCCYGTGHEGLFLDFYDCVENGRDFAIDGSEAAKVIKIILAAYASNGENIKI